MKIKRLPSLATLSKRDEPLDDLTLLIKRLISNKSENKYLEWKLNPPLGPNVTKDQNIVWSRLSFHLQIQTVVLFYSE